MQEWRQHVPQHATEATGADADIAATASPLSVRVGSGLILVAGVVTLFTGIQSTIFLNIRGAMAVMPYALVAFGGATIVSAILVWRMRGYGAIAATALCGMQVMITGFWLLFSMMHGLFSLYAMGAPMASVVGVVFAGLAIGPCTRASAARARLAAAGLAFGL